MRDPRDLWQSAIAIASGLDGCQWRNQYQCRGGPNRQVPLTFRVGTDEPLGEKTLRLAINEGEPLISIPLRVQIQRPIVMTVRGLKGEPGDSDVNIRISNRSAQPLMALCVSNCRLRGTPDARNQSRRAQTDGSARCAQPKCAGRQRGKQTKSPPWNIKAPMGAAPQQPLIPSRLTIYSAPNLTMDGDLKDWPAKNRLPDWVLVRLRAPRTPPFIWRGRTKVYIAVDVHDSKAQVPDPRSFWSGDVLELFLDTRDKKTPRAFEPGDHQFWMAPQFEQKRVYLGQWKRNAEIPETLYDLPNIQSTVIKRGDGYVMECLIPAALIKDFNQKAKHGALI